jgi:PAS domain S-box-containing protein
LLGGNSIATYLALDDVYGRPSLVVRLTKRREAGQQALECSIRVAVFSLTAGLILFVLMMALLEATVLHRLRSLVLQTKELKSANHLTEVSITVRGRDEVGKIAHGLRYLLDAMKANKFRWMRAEKRLQELLELSPMGILLAEPVNQRLYRINDSALKLLGYEKGKLTGKRLGHVFKSIGGKTDFAEVTRALDDDISQVEGIVRRGDGKEMRVTLKAGAIRQTEGELLIFAFVPANGDATPPEEK